MYQKVLVPRRTRYSEVECFDKNHRPVVVALTHEPKTLTLQQRRQLLQTVALLAANDASSGEIRSDLEKQGLLCSAVTTRAQEPYRLRMLSGDFDVVEAPQQGEYVETLWPARFKSLMQVHQRDVQVAFERADLLGVQVKLLMLKFPELSVQQAAQLVKST